MKFFESKKKGSQSGPLSSIIHVHTFTFIYNWIKVALMLFTHVEAGAKGRTCNTCGSGKAGSNGEQVRVATYM